METNKLTKEVQEAVAHGTVRTYVRRRLAKLYCKEKGLTGKSGGWIYNKAGKPVAQGYDNFYHKYRLQILAWAYKSGSLVHPSLAWMDANWN